MAAVGVSLRLVRKEDYPNILRWRNDPEVRKFSLNTSKIEWAEHERYWDAFLSEVNNQAYIIEKNGTRCGLVRIEGKNAEIHILISPKYWNRGIGAIAIKEARIKAKQLGLDRLIAKIKPENTASIRVFEKNGFAPKYILYEAQL